MYYNPIASYWEPFIERTGFSLELDEFSLKLKSKEGLDLNVSDTFIDVLAMTWESWNEKRPARGKQLMSRFNLAEESGSLERNDDEQGVCPFSVKNETGMDIYLSKMYGNEAKEVLIQNGSKFDIRIKYEETIENLLRASNENVILTDTLFKISFDSAKGYAAIKELNFNKVGSELHYLSQVRADLNYLIYSVALDKIMKVLTLRTPCQFRNKTLLRFKFTFFTSDEPQFTLMPNGTFAVPIELMETAFILSLEDNPKDAAANTQSVTHLLKLFATCSSVWLQVIDRRK